MRRAAITVPYLFRCICQHALDWDLYIWVV